jgi:hypothetical protein
MKLSNRGRKYLESIKRPKDSIISEEETKKLLKQKNIPSTDALVNFQKYLSGITIIEPFRKRKFDFHLFSKIKNGNNLQFEKIDEVYYLSGCISDEIAQFSFDLSSKGEIITFSYEDEPIIIYSSFFQKIEEYAFKAKKADWYENEEYYDLVDNLPLKKFLKSKFTKVNECSCTYFEIWENGSSFIEIGRWLGEKRKYLHVYGKNKQETSNIINQLKNDKVIN